MNATSTKWKRRKEARPAEILAAALDCFAQRGFAATRMDDVAARAGVTKGTVYLYFPTKEDLFKALVREELLPNLAALEGVALEAGPVAPFFERMLKLWAEHIAATPIGVVPKLMIAEAGNFPELAKFYLHEVVERIMALIRRVVQRGIDAGEFRPVDTQYVAHCVVGPLLLTMLWEHSFARHAGASIDAAALAKTHADLLLGGLLVSPRDSKPKTTSQETKKKRISRKRGES